MTTRYEGRPASALVDEQESRTPGERSAARVVFAGLRVVVGFTFLWAFLDKLFGLGYATASERSWLNGGSPTRGFLANSPSGPFEGAYKDIAGAAWADWLFMLGLAGIGVALLLGIGMRVAAVSGALLYVLMWTVVLPPENNPVVDDHLIGALVVIALALVHAGDTFGLGRWWKAQPIVQHNRWLI
jgi:thiosulfate dehydrogenase [quinone] large subunit